MKRYGDNLPSKGEEEIEATRGELPEVLRGGCSVRYGMLDFILGAQSPRKRKPARGISLKLQKKEQSAEQQ